MGIADVVAVLRADASDFTAKLGELCQAGIVPTPISLTYCGPIGWYMHAKE
jgi:hypothetical protein